MSFIKLVDLIVLNFCCRSSLSAFQVTSQWIVAVPISHPFIWTHQNLPTLSFNDANEMDMKTSGIFWSKVSVALWNFETFLQLHLANLFQIFIEKLLKALTEASDKVFLLSIKNLNQKINGMPSETSEILRCLLNKARSIWFHRLLGEGTPRISLHKCAHIEIRDAKKITITSMPMLSEGDNGAWWKFLHDNQLVNRPTFSRSQAHSSGHETHAIDPLSNTEQITARCVAFTRPQVGGET
jgi:hypothetical protein